MEDDGMFLNITTTTTTKPSQTKNMNKTELKKQKYSQKMKKMTEKNRDHSSKRIFKAEDSAQAQLFNLMNHQQTKDEKKNSGQRNDRKRSKPKMQESRQAHDKKEERTPNREGRSYSRYGQDRRMRGQNTEYNERRRNAPEIQPQNMKKVNVDQLLPLAAEEKNFINKTQLQNFDLHPKLIESLKSSGVQKMTEIQAKSFKSVFNSCDSVLKATTGSGKTLAYLIPLINRIISKQLISDRKVGTTIMIICPTRQLCVQGQKQVLRCLKRFPFIVPGCLYGGEETNHEKARLRKGTNILFCTPGRVLYHLENTQSFKITNLQALVFEEADRTLDMGFEQTINKILKLFSQKLSLDHIQKILVSAHFNTKVSDLLESLEMSESKFIGFQQQMSLQKLKVNKDTEINASSQLKQQYVLITEDQKIPLLLAYLGVLKDSKILIFVSTIDEVEFFDYLLNNLKYRDSNGFPTESKVQTRNVYKIHGDLDQKLRSKTYLEFRASQEAILISTEVAARGLDFPDLSHIILFDVPPTITDYGNRVGRSARFNQTGVSLLMLHYQESDYAQKIRYYAPQLQMVNKQVVFDNFNKVLKSMNIGDNSLHYLEGLVRGTVKDDDEKYQVARKAYVSMLRAYTRLADKHIFQVKKLNLKLLARTFGLNNAQADKAYNPKAKQSHLEAIRKKRRVQDVKKLEVSEYL